jgi:diguanylate cyclase (GGDEF)-like protein/PAS domain S-box-containing protein
MRMNDTASQPRPLRVLIVEDTPDDALLLLRALKRVGFEPEHLRVDGAEAMREALAAGSWDIVISDYTMPDFSALQALEIAKGHDADLPFIIVSGNIGEEVAVGAMRAGAQDYLLKHSLARLGPVVAREVEESAIRHSHREAESRLRSEKARINDILGSLGDIVWSVGLPELRMNFMNAAAEAILDRPLSELLGGLDIWLAEIIHPGDRDRMRNFFGDILRNGAQSIEYRILRPDGEVRWLLDRARLVKDDAGKKLRIDGIASDITGHKQSQEQLYRAAHFDALTGLPNRKQMEIRLQQELALAGQSAAPLALLFIDFDRIKTINDSLGHNAGDIVLAELASRMRGALREGDTIARIGGDEFVTILPDIRHAAAVEGVLAKLAAAIAPAIAIGEHIIHSTASIGVALFPQDGDDGETLLKNADVAMYAAKRAGRDAWRFYAPEMNAASAGLLALENELRGALGREELELHYQPQVDLVHGRISGFEALLRWRHPVRGLVSPAEFIPLAEETGLIVPIGEWVLREACRQARIWSGQFDPKLCMAVNLSARQFVHAGLLQSIAAALADSGLAAANLELELTESLVMHEPEKSAGILHELKAMGITLAMDDFGTGYSSLAYLNRFPLDVLKIDRSFVKGIGEGAGDAALCEAIIAMAGALCLEVVAEGVETHAQLGFLAERHCDRMQGFLFSRPLAAAAAGELLREGRCLRMPGEAAGSVS